jgi:hypothetical protein
MRNAVISRIPDSGQIIFGAFDGHGEAKKIRYSPRTVLSSRSQGKTNFAQELFGGEWLLNKVVWFWAGEWCASLSRAAGD